MTAKIYSFEAAKTVKAAPKPRKKVLQTPSEIFDDVYSDIVDEWQHAAKTNKLNEYVGGKLPLSARGPEYADYVNDLNVISRVEQKLNMTLSINSPQFSSNKVGWLVIFNHEKEAFSGSSDMVIESYARAFNVILYVEFNNRLKKLKKK